MSEKNKLPREIFNEAVEIADAQQRAAYLTSACGDDAALRQQVEALIQSHQAAGAFLNETTETELVKRVERQNQFLHVALGEKVFPTGEPGDQIDRYKLLQQIG